MKHTVKVTTINPAMPGLICRVVESGNEDNVLVDAVLDSGGSYFEEVEADRDIVVALLLIDDEGEELIRCRVPIGALSPVMECFMTNPKRLTADQAHKNWRAKYREMKRRGIENPDPDDVARAAFL